MPQVDVDRIHKDVVEHLGGLFIDFEQRVKQQAEANAQERAVVEQQVAA